MHINGFERIFHHWISQARQFDPCKFVCLIVQLQHSYDYVWHENILHYFLAPKKIQNVVKVCVNVFHTAGWRPDVSIMTWSYSYSSSFSSMTWFRTLPRYVWTCIVPLGQQGQMFQWSHSHNLHHPWAQSSDSAHVPTLDPPRLHLMYNTCTCMCSASLCQQNVVICKALSSHQWFSTPSKRPAFSHGTAHIPACITWNPVSEYIVLDSVLIDSNQNISHSNSRPILFLPAQNHKFTVKSPPALCRIHVK